MTAYIYLIYRVDRGKADTLTIINVALGCFVITMTKSSGVALAVFAMVFIIIDVFACNKENVKKFFKKKINFAIVLIPIAFILFGKLTWNWYVEHYDVRAGWDASEMTFANILNWIKEPTTYQRQVTKSFFKTFFIGNFSLGDELQLPYLFVFAIVIGLCIFLGYSTKNKKFAISQGIATLVLSIGYGVSLLFLYIFSFAYWEGLSLASYWRYNSTNLLAMVLIYFFLFTDLYAERLENKLSEKCNFYAKLQKVLSPLILGIYLVATIGLSVGGFYKFTSDANNFRVEYKEWISTVENLEKDDSVYIVVKDDEQWTQAFKYIHMRFLAAPMQTSGYLEGGSYVNGREAEVCYTGNPFSMEQSVEDFEENVSKYTHVYLHEVWEKFTNKYGALFDGEITEKTLYKVERGEEKVKLVAVKGGS